MVQAGKKHEDKEESAHDDHNAESGAETRVQAIEELTHNTDHARGWKVAEETLHPDNPQDGVVLDEIAPSNVELANDSRCLAAEDHDKDNGEEPTSLS